MTVRRIAIAVGAAVAVAGGAAAIFAGPAGAAPSSSPVQCSADQVTAKLVYGGAGAGNRNAALQFTANPGERCSLPGRVDVGLIGAHNVLVNNEAAADAPPVVLSDGSSAYVPLHWTAIAPEEEQQTPNGITVPGVTVDWPFGAVDANEGSHTIDVGALVAGVAPAV
ncbi:DUF4232 domain-containing protein [Amycolatopsis jejuensis]|uniref:DUF4232 domain-containing protein n=1 Tax=Amycolatopsis jejuensis TaxID=330084 RepID=UPI00052743B6|nr:DUF4232 domain-containing protein [Amycolatopsis jejuensis]